LAVKTKHRKVVIKPVIKQKEWYGILIRTREQIIKVWPIPYGFKIDMEKLKEWQEFIKIKKV